MNKRQREIIRKKHLQRKKRKKRNAMIRKALLRTVILFILVLVVRLLIKGDELKGAWDCDGVTVYRFDGRGKGALIVPDSIYAFDYEINEEKVHIDFEDENAIDYTYQFSVKKEKLILSGNEGKESFFYEFTRIKE